MLFTRVRGFWPIATGQGYVFACLLLPMVNGCLSKSFWSGNPEEFLRVGGQCPDWSMILRAMVNWLVVHFFLYIGNNHPNWLSYFQRGWNHQPVKSYVFPCSSGWSSNHVHRDLYTPIIRNPMMGGDMQQSRVLTLAPNWLVAWNINFMTFHSVGNAIIPTDFIFSDGLKSPTRLYIYMLVTSTISHSCIPPISTIWLYLWWIRRFLWDSPDVMVHHPRFCRWNQRSSNG